MTLTIIILTLILYPKIERYMLGPIIDYEKESLR